MPIGYVPGAYLNMAVKLVDVAGVPTILPCLAQKNTDSPQSFYGILKRDLPTPVVTVGRGSITSPLVEGGGPLTPDVDVYLSTTTPGYVTQSTMQPSGTVQLRVGVALDATRVVLANDFRVDYY